MALARRHDPLRHKDDWGRVRGWERIDIAVLPSLGFDHPPAEDALLINSFIPVSDTVAAAPSFLLNASIADRARAIDCLSQAVYFEADLETGEGKRAVAQVVLNRLRHTGHPKSVCGVVYQRARRATGYQFSFVCDGALTRPVNPAARAEAQMVARQALARFVKESVGVSTYYHADYVVPYWAPTLVKLAQVAAHIFYRWTGPAGDPGALNSQYAGGEANLSLAVLKSDDARTPDFPSAPAEAPPPKIVQLDQAGGMMRSYTISDRPVAAGGATIPSGPGLGVLSPTHRKPAPEEVRAINAALAQLPEAQPPTSGSTLP